MADAAAAPITPLSGPKKLSIEILTRAAGAAVKIATAGIINENDTKTAIEGLVDYIRAARRTPPKEEDYTVVGRALSNLFHKPFFIRLGRQTEEAIEKYQNNPTEENEENLRIIMENYEEYIELANRPPITFGELCFKWTRGLSRSFNSIRPYFGLEQKWTPKAGAARVAAFQRGMCEEENATIVAARNEQRGIISRALGVTPKELLEDPEPPSGGKRRNKTRKPRARKGRKGLKSRKA